MIFDLNGDICRKCQLKSCLSEVKCGEQLLEDGDALG